MTENEMGYRGTKSKFNFLNFVKAQRVDGRWYEGYTSYQRCTLKDFERDYQFRIPTRPFESGATSKVLTCKKPVALPRELNQGVVLSYNLLEATAKSIPQLLMATNPAYPFLFFGMLPPSLLRREGVD